MKIFIWYHSTLLVKNETPVSAKEGEDEKKLSACSRSATDDELRETAEDMLDEEKN